MPRLLVPHQFRIIFVVLSSLIAHMLEIILFAFAYYFMQASQGRGQLIGDFKGTFLDCVYYSAITYTILGFGDIIPAGEIRFVTAMEALIGLILIAWTAAFIYKQLEKGN